MSFIHPDASLMDTKRSHPLELVADRVNVEDGKRFAPESIETRASASSSPRDQLQIKIVMLKVQVIFAISRILSGSAAGERWAPGNTRDELHVYD